MPSAYLFGFTPCLSFAENAAAQRLDTDVTFAWGSVVGGTMTIAGVLAEDRVSIQNVGTSAGQIGFNGTSVTYSGTIIGTASGGAGTTFTVTLNASASSAAVEALIENLTYADVSDAPTATHALTITPVDSSGQPVTSNPSLTTTFDRSSDGAFDGIDVGYLSTPSFGDWDGDGDLDLLVGNSEGNLRAWRNTGSAAAPAFTELTGGANPFDGFDVGRNASPSFIDWDRDGDLDLVSGSYDGTLLAWRNTGSTTAPVFTAVAGSNNPFNGIDVGFYSSPSLVDWDGDGDLDLISGAADGVLQAWRNTGSATLPVFTPLFPFQRIDMGDFTTTAFFDWDRDGDFDLIVAEAETGTWDWQNTGAATAPFFTLISPRSASPSGISVVDRRADLAFADWDGDGDLDFVVGGIYGTLAAYRNLDRQGPFNLTINVTAQNDAPVITSGAAANFAENGTGVAYQAAAFDVEGNALIWSLGGADAGLFNVGSAGAVSFKTAPNFEAPGDAGPNNVYDLTVTASDGAASSTARAIAIAVTNVNEAPVFTSGAAPVFAANGTGIAYQAVASDPEGGALTWWLSGADAARFAINGAGAVRFVTAPILAAPVDVGGNNVYDIVVSAADTALNRTDRAVAITVALGNASIGSPSNTRSGEDFNAGSGSVRILGTITVSDPDASEAFFQSTVSAAPGTLGSLNIGGPEGTAFYTYSVSNAALQYLRAGDVLVETFTVTSLDGTTGNISFQIDGRDDPTVIGEPNHPDLWVDRNVNGGYLEVRGNLSISDADQGEGSFRGTIAPNLGFFRISPDGSYFYAVENDLVKYLAYGQTRVETAVVFSLGGTPKGLSFTIHGPDAAPVINSLATASFLENAAGTVYTAAGIDPEAVALTWSLSGTDAALFNFNAATRALTFKTAPNFEAPADAGADNVYDVVVNASDGTQSTAKSVAITIANVREKPVVAGLQSAAGFAENTVNVTPQRLDADVTATVDSSFVGGTLIVSGLLTGDRVSIGHVGNGAGQIGFADGTVSFNGTIIGTATGGSGGNLTVTLNSAASSASVEALVEALTYANVSDNPTLARSLTLNLIDAGIPDLTFTALTGTANPFASIDVGDFSTPNFVDLDGDGRVDLVVGEFNGTLLALRNTGSGFTALTGAANPFAGIDIADRSAPTFVDLDGDGRLDLVVGGLVGPLQAWRNTVGGFTALTGAPNPFGAIVVAANNKPTFVDLDGDGRQDLVVGEAAGTLLAWRNTGSGFTALTGAANPFNGFDVGDRATPTFVDLEGDGRLDLVSGEYAGALLAWRNTGSGFIALTGTANPFSGVDVDNRSAPSFVDLDGDGRLDLVVGQGLGILSAWRNVAGVGSPITVTVTAQNDAPSVTSGAAASFAENGTGIAYQGTATDPDAGSILSWVLGGADAALFDIDTAGAVTFKVAPNSEAPVDGTADNIYDITVMVSDGTLSSTLNAVAITVTDVNEAPSVTSGGSASFAENGTATAYAATGSDPDAGTVLAWSLSGTDAALFDLDGATGTVTFKTAPNFEAPADAGADNIYDIVLTASDGTLSEARDVSVAVTDANEAPVLVTASLSVAEGVQAVGTLAAADPDAAPSLRFSLPTGVADNDTFTIDALTGALRFVEPAGGDYETKSSYGLVVRVADPMDAALFTEGAVAITVLDVQDFGTPTAGPDLLVGTPEADFLSGLEGDDTLLGLADADTLLGGEGKDRLDGGLGADSLVGGSGDDTYFVDDAADTVVEAALGGFDRINARVSFTLGAEVERLSLRGKANLDGTGTDVADRIDGNAGANRLDGGGGNDRLDGRLGADSLKGGLGDDRYDVDDAADIVVELAGEAYDRVVASIDWTLGAASERLSLSGTADLAGAGNGMANRLDGNAGANILDGGAGNDALHGGAGQDTLIGGDGADLLDGDADADELTGGAGNDVFRFASNQAQGDAVIDFAGNGAGPGDRLEFKGFGTAAQGASFVQIDATTCQVNSADGATHAVITFANAAALHSLDWSFG